MGIPLKTTLLKGHYATLTIFSTFWFVRSWQFHVPTFNSILKWPISAFSIKSMQCVLASSLLIINSSRDYNVILPSWIQFSIMIIWSYAYRLYWQAEYLTFHRASNVLNRTCSWYTRQKYWKYSKKLQLMKL